MPPRFYAPHLDPALADVILPPAESQHLARVLRLRPGAVVEVFNGRGVMARGTVSHSSTSGATIAVGQVLTAQPEPPHPLTLCAPLLKGDAMDAVIRDATVLGVTTIVPMTTARTNVPLERSASGRLHERWHRVAVAAAKQCGRARLPDMLPVQPAVEVLTASSWQTWQRRVLVEPAVVAGLPGAANAGAMRSVAAPAAAPLALAFGPEGGWAEAELAAFLEAGWEPWSLGPFTLRAEHVTLAALCVVRYQWGA